MLVSAVLAEFADEVVVVERDVLPSCAAPRKGLPQAQHAHILWSGGARAVERILPGILDEWRAAGATRIPLPEGLVSMTPQGWFRRWTAEMQYVLSCSRDLLDWCVRRRVLRMPAVRLRDGTEVVGLLGDAGRVTGVRLAGSPGVLEADLVVDASGRGTRAAHWLREFGVRAAPEATVDSGVVYATRVYRAPVGAERYPMVNVQPKAGTGRPGRGAVIAPLEGGRWVVTLMGTRGGQPSADPDAFVDFARGVRHPLVGELISHAVPVSSLVRLSRSTGNRRRYYERAKDWPGGFVALGDAVASFNPVYGHGMSVAALSAEALRAELVAGFGPGLARRVQRAVAAPTDMAWQLAAAQDIHYPEATGTPPTPLDRLTVRYVDRLTRTATTDPRATRALLEVMTLSAPASALFRPSVALTALRGPRRAALAGPPLTAAERSLVCDPG
ncbi:NAD(P)/FAD-dependent oxidoreductase [Streptomyces sp. O3]